MFALAAAATVDEMRGTSWLGEALAELGIGAIVGTAIGFAGGWLLRWARDPGWVAENFAGIAVLALALLAYTAVLRVHGNGFVAAFYAGLAFGASAGRRGPTELVFLEQLTSLLVWLAFGALVIPVVADAVDLVVALYAILSLTLLRMVPVALACIGAGLDRNTVVFVGWFGPRGARLARLRTARSGTTRDRRLPCSHDHRRHRAPERRRARPHSRSAGDRIRKRGP